MIASVSQMNNSSLPDARPRVLVADDNPDMTCTVATLLNADGYRTIIAHNGVDALRIVQEQQPEVVLLDLNMPKMSGIDACKAIRQLNLRSQPAIIAMTGFGSDRDVEFCQSNGFDDYSVKGQEFSHLKAQIDKLVAEKRSV